jgi:hypothetical protein
VCTPSTTITCEVLSKPLCDRYQVDGAGIEGVSVDDSPCFFNGPGDSVFLRCVSIASVVGDSCAMVETNDVANGDGKRYCDDASLIFGFVFNCVWKEEDGEGGVCLSTYYLTGNGIMTCLM